MNSSQNSIKNAISESTKNIATAISESTITIVNALAQSTQALQASIDTNSSKLDRLQYDTIVRISRLENQVVHIDKSVEIKISDRVHEFLQTLATQSYMRFTYKMGKNFIKKISDPQTSRVITDFDGCYILSNDVRNSKFVNNDKASVRTELVNKLESQLSKKKNELLTAETKKKAKIQDKINKTQKALNDLKKMNASKTIDSILNNIILPLELEQVDKHSLPNKRYICIIEAKTYLSENELKDQVNKMIDLINYFRNVYLFHMVKPQPYIAWTKEFRATNTQFNLLFDGIILLVGGEHYVESILKQKLTDCQDMIDTYIQTTIEDLSQYESDPVAAADIAFLKTIHCKLYMILSKSIVERNVVHNA